MKSRTKNLVSIITIVLNGEEQIEQTILSVLNQKNVKIEYIIIDGGSRDKTLQILEKYKDKIDILISEPDNGIYDAINKGIKLANGELIGIIHCGDFYTPDTISLSINTYVKTKADVIYGDITTIEEIDNQTYNCTKHANHLMLRKEMSIFHPSSFITKDCYSKHGMYDIKYKIAADYDLFLRYFNLGLSFYYIPQSLAYFRIGGVSSSNIKVLINENIAIKRCQIGRREALKFKYTKILINNFFALRKSLMISLIGKTNYTKLKINFRIRNQPQKQ